MSDRIKYIEGSSLPHFEGDKSTMTPEEAMELTNRRQHRRVAEAVGRTIEEFLNSDTYFQDAVNDITTQVAREVMGRGRPFYTEEMPDDDPPYYKFQNDLFERAKRHILSNMQAFIDDIA